MLSTTIDWLLTPPGLTPHGFCLSWEPELLWLHAFSDAAIGLSYFAIPLFLMAILRGRSDLTFRPLFIPFAAFILLCGTGHWLDLVTLWVPVYGIEGVVKAMTAIVSLMTVFTLWKLLPQVLSWPSPVQLQSSNENLERLSRNLIQARDRAERANRTKSRFLAGMSHELRTPLAGIMGYARLLQAEGSLSPKQECRVNAMLTAGKHLMEMIAGVLDMSEIESDHVTLRLDQIDLQTTLNACLDLVRPNAEAKGLDLTLTLKAGTPKKITTDPVRLRQILLNMLGNAVKFTSRGGVTLALGPSPDGLALLFEVADTGPGIPTACQDRLFQEFEQLAVELASKVEGSGLGLAISNRLATVMGGRLGYRDNPGGGSVFWLELPLNMTAELPAALPAAERFQVEAKAQSDHSLTVLIVDDVEMNRDIASAFLGAAGHKVVCAEGGAEAVAAAASADFDAILMDVRMPEVDGLEATRRIRALDGARGRVPIVAVTAQAFTGQIAECREAGMNGHLAKPFDPAELLAAVVAAVDDRLGPKPPVQAAPARTAVHADPAGPAPEAALPIFDLAAFDQTACFLASDNLDTCLRQISTAGEQFKEKLRAPATMLSNSEALAEVAHRLAGTAGMFGFMRLSNLGRNFEHAIRSKAPEAVAIANEFCLAIDATDVEIRARTRR